MMLRPIKVIVKDEEIWENQRKNLQSALALAALRTPDGATEQNLYENVVSIPHYTMKKLHTLVDKEDEREVVSENIERFKQMYRPIWSDGPFKEVFNITENG
jgi:hypothetical protein